MLSPTERITFHSKIYPLAKKLAENPYCSKYIEPISLTKLEYAHAKYLEYNMRYFTKQRVKRAA